MIKWTYYRIYKNELEQLRLRTDKNSWQYQTYNGDWIAVEDHLLSQIDPAIKDHGYKTFRYISTEEEYQYCLNRIEALIDAKPGTLEFLELDEMANLICDYDDMQEQLESRNKKVINNTDCVYCGSGDVSIYSYFGHGDPKHENEKYIRVCNNCKEKAKAEQYIIREDLDAEILHDYNI